MPNENNKLHNFVTDIIENDLVKNPKLKIQTRFPPEPNGFLHIGHAKAICLNFAIAKQYNGLCNLRFDDTNPEKEEDKYVKSIINDINWLGFKPDGDIKYSSDYFEMLFKFALELIEKNLAYVCFLTSEKTREYRGTLTTTGKDSPYKNQTPKQNKEHFLKMRQGEYKEGHCVLRAKIDMKSSNISMRDPVLYRIKFAKHHRSSDKWCIYPMYDFTHCISDAIENITHSLCSLEFQDNRALYDWILDNISIKSRPHQYEFSRLNLDYSVLSKRKLQKLVLENHVKAWDDPRMPTISGMKNRGYLPESIIKFSRSTGVTKQNHRIDFSQLESFIRTDLENLAPRKMAVLNPVKLTITNYPKDKQELLDLANHPKDESFGTRKVPFSNQLYIEQEDFKEQANKKFKRLVLQKEVRLRGSYVIKATDIKKDSKGNIIEILCTYDKDTLGKNPLDGRKVKGVIHWVCAKDNLKAQVNLFDRLFIQKNPESLDNFLEAINPNSLIEIKDAILEKSFSIATKEERFQFERLGYFYLENIQNKSLFFNRIVALKDSWSNIK